jgi:hypothetical protein
MHTTFMIQQEELTLERGDRLFEGGISGTVLWECGCEVLLRDLTNALQQLQQQIEQL